MDDLSGRIIRGYELRERIGAGGFGAVYRAHQAVIGREVAVKVILPEYANHPDFVRNFEAEAQLVARLEHPHIIPLYDYWREPGGAYLIMRWLPGGSLRTMLQQHGPLPPEQVSRLLDQVAAALMAAHRNGVVHRDIKPDNILLDEDENAYLADFGIAKDLRKEDGAHSGGVVGSPAYLAPEQIKSEPVSPQTDLYGLGIVLYELLTGERPFAGDLTSTALIFSQLNDPLPPLSHKNPALPPALDEVVQQATAKDPKARYPDARTMALAFREALYQGSAREDEETLTLLPIAPAGRSRLLPTDDLDELTLISIALGAPENPYKGLRAFEEADSADFFGREALIEQLLGRLREDTPHARFLAVVGPSGSGKSSVVKAGLIPALRRGALPDSERWFIAEMVPGPQPLKELETALLGVAVKLPEGYDLHGQLQASSRGLLEAVEVLLPEDRSCTLVLFIDQFEEAFTQASDEAACAHLLNSLLTAVNDPASRLCILLTLRADFYDRPLLYPAFGDLIRQRTEVVLPLSPDELAQAIAGPAERVGLLLEPGLVEKIVAEVGEQPGALPLLQYALTELYERRDGITLTLEAYRDSGGVLGALARRADELYVGLDEAHRDAARQLFLRLVTPGEGTEDTRRRARQTELMGTGNEAAMTAVLDLYGKFRLLTFDRDPETRLPTVEVAHEALIRTWARLREWLDSSREAIRLQRRLSAAAAEWMNAGREPSFLAAGARLVQFEALLADPDMALNQEETEYVQASAAERRRRESEERARQERELAVARQAAQAAQQAAAAQRQAANRLKYLAGALALFFVVALGLSLFAFDRQAQALQNEEKAWHNAATATVAQGKALHYAATSVANAATATVAQGKALHSAATAAANFTRSEALRLAAEANGLVQSGGDPQLVGLLGIRSIGALYTSQGDKALTTAATLSFPLHGFKHGASVNAVAFSPDGRYLLTGSWDKTARLWALGDNALVGTFSGHADAVLAVAFSPDNRYALTGSRDKTLRLWEAESGRLIRTFTGHDDAVTAVAFSPDGQYVLSGSDDYTARLWEAQTGEVVRILSHRDFVNAVAFSPDGRLVLTGCSDEKAYLWDAGSGQQRRTLSGHTGDVLAVAFSPDGQYVLTGGWDRTARLWDALSGALETVLTGHTDGIYGVVFSPDMAFILTASADKTARLWDTTSGAEIQRFAGHQAALNSAAFSPDGDTFATGGMDWEVLLWKTQDDRTRRVFGGHDDDVYSVGFSPDGRYILSGGFEGAVILRDRATGKIRHMFYEESITGAFSPDGQRVLTSGYDGTAYLWDAGNGRLLHTLAGHSDEAGHGAFSPDGRLVLTTSFDGTARLWDARTGQALHILSGHEDGVLGGAFSPDGRHVLTGGADSTARLWDAETGELLHTFTAHEDWVYAVAFSPDGRFFLTGSSDGTIRLWDAQTWAEARVFSARGRVLSAAFSPDGRYVLATCGDSAVCLWDARSGDLMRELLGHAGAVVAVAFSPDGKFILTGGADKAVRLWDTDYRDTIASICQRLWDDFPEGVREQFGIRDAVPTCPHFGRVGEHSPDPTPAPGD